jgi:hypothetical protein
MQVLRIHVSSEEDPYFLHTLEVTEDEFQSLKAEQGILVDFASFPGKIISLLERCIASQAADMPRFQAVLAVRAADSGLKIVETNDFKQLPHITLAFRPGNNFTVKQVCNHSQATAVQQLSYRQRRPHQMCTFDSFSPRVGGACCRGMWWLRCWQPTGADL